MALVFVGIAAPVSGSDVSFMDRLSGQVTLQHGYQFQGIDQSQGDLMLHLGASYQLSDNITAGVWLGEYTLPHNIGKSTEIDYFLGYNKALSFSHTVRTSLWHYSFTDKDMSTYDWTQWLLGYEYDGWFNLTLGFTRDFGLRDNSASFAELNFSHSFEPGFNCHFGHLTTSLSFGRNNLSNTGLSRIDYLRLKAIHSWQHWNLFADFTFADSDTSPFVAEFIHEGWGFGITYKF